MKNLIHTTWCSSAIPTTTSSTPRIHTARFQSGTTEYRFLGFSADAAQEAAKKKADKLMESEDPIHWDGWRESIEVHPEWVDQDYVWHADGNRVRCSRAHVRVDGIGEDRKMTRTSLRPSWREF